MSSSFAIRVCTLEYKVQLVDRAEPDYTINHGDRLITISQRLRPQSKLSCLFYCYSQAWLRYMGFSKPVEPGKLPDLCAVMMADFMVDPATRKLCEALAHVPPAPTKNVA